MRLHEQDVRDVPEAFALHPSSTPHPEPRLRILIADDHLGVREAMACLLTLIGFEIVAQAEDGAVAVALAKQVTPDLILMDLSMPVLNGLDATRLIHRALPGTPVVILSAYDSAELRHAAQAAGAAAYLVKGLPVETLRTTLLRLLPTAPNVGPTTADIVAVRSGRDRDQVG